MTTTLVASVCAAALVVMLAEAKKDSWIDDNCDDLGTVSTLVVGDGFETSCRYNASLVDSNSKVQFYKGKVCFEKGTMYTYTGNEAPDDNEVLTLNATDLHEYLVATGRYSVNETMEEDDNFVKYTLTINGVMPEDLGTLGCQRIDVTEAPSFVERHIVATLRVEGPSLGTTFKVTDFCNLSAYSNHPACSEEDPKAVELHTGQEFTFHNGKECKVMFSLEYDSDLSPTNVEVFIATGFDVGDDGDEGILLRLPTRDALPSTGAYLLNPNGTLLNLTRVLGYLNMDFNPLYSYNGKPILARMTRTVYPVEVLPVVDALNVTFPPSEISCNKTLQHTKGASTTFVMSCQALGNPTVLAFWKLESDKLEASQKYSIDSQVDNDLTISTLMIFDVTRDDYGEYFVVFENDFGTEIMSATNLTTIGNGCSRQTTTSGLFTTLWFLLALILIVA